MPFLTAYLGYLGSARFITDAVLASTAFALSPALAGLLVNTKALDAVTTAAVATVASNTPLNLVACAFLLNIVFSMLIPFNPLALIFN
jgi:hypothetical protein